MRDIFYLLFIGSLLLCCKSEKSRTPSGIASNIIPNMSNELISELEWLNEPESFQIMDSSLSVTVMGLPLTYNRDLQEDKEPLFDSARTLLDSLEVMSGAIATLGVRTERMADAAADPMLLATDLAEILVVAGVPFRDAHEVVGRIVGHCTRENVSLRSLTHADMQSFHAAFEAGADELLALERSLESRQLVGGTSRSRVEAALAEIGAELAAERVAIEAAAAAEAEAEAEGT